MANKQRREPKRKLGVSYLVQVFYLLAACIRTFGLAITNIIATQQPVINPLLCLLIFLFGRFVFGTQKTYYQILII